MFIQDQDKRSLIKILEKKNNLIQKAPRLMWPKQLVDLVNVYIEQSKIIFDSSLASATLFIIYCVWSLSLDIVLFESAVSCGNNMLQIVLFVFLYRGEERGDIRREPMQFLLCWISGDLAISERDNHRHLSHQSVWSKSNPSNKIRLTSFRKYISFSKFC